MVEPSNPSSDEAVIALLARGLKVIDDRRGELSKEILSMAGERPSLTIPKGTFDDDIAALVNAEANSHDWGFRNFLVGLQMLRLLRTAAGSTTQPPLVSVETEKPA